MFFGRRRIRQHIFNGRLFENCVMAGPGYVSSAGGHDIKDLPRLLPNRLGCALDENMMRVNSSVEKNLVAETRLQFL
jgi:hypothetical protein